MKPLKLKPCPFCGGKNLITVKNYVLCLDCHTHGPYTDSDGQLIHTIIGAEKAWNKRARIKKIT